MRVKITDPVKWKKELALVLSRVEKKASNPIEGCVLIEANEEMKRVLVKGVRSDSLQITRTISEGVEVVQEGEVYIPASSISSLNETLQKDSCELIATRNSLSYKIAKFGSVSEPLFSGEWAFPDMGLGELSAGIQLLYSGHKDKFIEAANKLSSISISSIEISVTGKAINMYGQTEYGLIRYSIGEDNDETYRIVLPCSSVKNLSLLKDDETSIYGGTNPLYIKGVSSKGYLYLLGSDEEIEEYRTTDEVVSQDYKARALVKSEDLIRAIAVQSYGTSDVSDNLCISLDNEVLTIKGTRTDEGSILSASSTDSFKDLRLPIKGASHLSSLMSSYDLLLIDLYEKEMDNSDCIRAISIKPGEAVEIDCVYILYEQVMLE